MKNLKVLRESSGVSQQKLADAIGSNQQSVHRYENGDYEPDIQTLILLADYFDVSVDFLVGRTEIREKVKVIDSSGIDNDEVSLIEKYRELTYGYKKYILTVLAALLDAICEANNE